MDTDWVDKCFLCQALLVGAEDQMPPHMLRGTLANGHDHGI